MVASKQALQKVPTNIATEKVELKRKLIEAQESGDAEQIQEIEERLAKLDEIALQKRKEVLERMEGFSKLNERNKDTNFYAGRDAERGQMNRPKPRMRCVMIISLIVAKRLYIDYLDAEAFLSSVNGSVNGSPMIRFVVMSLYLVYQDSY
jgi:DNA-binding protein H-NS